MRGGVLYEQTGQFVPVGALSGLWQQNADKGESGYCSCEISAVLPQMQKGNAGQRGQTENGTREMSRTYDAEPASP